MYNEKILNKEDIFKTLEKDLDALKSFSFTQSKFTELKK